MFKKVDVASFPDTMLSILECCHDGICISDGETYLYANSSYERITGIDKSQIIGKKIENVLSIIERPLSIEVMKKKHTVSAWKENNGRELILTGTPLFDEDEKVKYIITNVRDLTELVELRRRNILYQKGNKPEDVLLEEKMVMESPAIKKIIQKALKVAKSESSVLLLGESGVGKGMIARYIHNKSFRSDKPFISVNCGAIPKDLIESELFGYAPGSFTGASAKGKKGLFQVADGGTLFLDEIGELSLELQVKLLHAIQEKSITPVGGTKPIPVNVRIFSATNKNLEDMVTKGQFRLDLYYRINVIPIRIPPLRERKEDIPELIKRKLEELHNLYRTPTSLNEQMMENFMNHEWPGNIRELENVIERMVILQEYNVQNMDIHNLLKNGKQRQYKARENKTLVALVQDYEKEIIEQALVTSKNQKHAALLLGINEATLSRKINKYDLKKVFSWESNKQ